MPASYIKSFAEKTGKDVKEVEKLYEKAKKVVEEEYKLTEKDGDKFYQIVTGVLKKMLGITTTDAICGSCGTGVDLSDKFCGSCGVELHDADTGKVNEIDTLVKKIATLTANNDHNGSFALLADFLKSKKHQTIAKAIDMISTAEGSTPSDLIKYRSASLQEMMKTVESKYGADVRKKVYGAF